MNWRYVTRRVLAGFVIYVIIIFIYSCLFNAVLEETARANIEEQIKKEQMGLRNVTPQQMENFQKNRRAELYERYHLDVPIIQRIVWTTIDTITFNYGRATSMRSNTQSQEVSDIIFEAIPNSILLFTTNMLISFLIGLFLGLKNAQKPGKLLDRITSVGALISMGLPSWWLAMMFIMFFCYTIGIFPSGGIHSVPLPQGIYYYLDILYHMALPLITLVVIGFWGNAYVIRNLSITTLQEDFVMSARARGLPERKILYGHTLRTISPAVVTMGLLGLLVSMGGSLVFEGIFSWPGLGRIYWIALQQNDIPVLVANLAITTGLFIAGLVFLDLTYGVLDPRIRTGD
jgi:ABC-type dipeptide/oligopeptide/nickel transport systems, permease components